MTESNDLRLIAVMPAPPATVHAALTDAAALRAWLAEHAEVALPDRYEFWGRDTPDGAEPHQRVLHAGERDLRLAWTVGGVETTVEFTVAEDDAGDAGSALLTLTQSDLPTFEEILSDKAGPRGELQTFWTLAIANLADYLADRDLTPRPDYTATDLSGSVVIDAAPQAVFDSLTQAEHVRRWSGVHVDIEPYVGGRYAMGGFDVDPGGMKYVEFEPGRKATLRFADGFTSSWELEGSDGKTRLTFVQSGFDPENPPYAGWAGWLSGVAALRRYHELPQWRSIWRLIDAPGVPAEMFVYDA
ncbi:SRPBCC family protein [Dactylosporangium sp. NPDC005555]|uniref:SRPBCC family protein n=1 Tax=Dactylosporangium sp. NPDC005555 TaxID=3154889 RepID=UPI0033AE1062